MAECAWPFCLRAMRFHRAPLDGLEEIEATIVSDRAIGRVHRTFFRRSRSDRCYYFPGWRDSHRSRCRRQQRGSLRQHSERGSCSALSTDSCIWRGGTIRPLGDAKICAVSRNRFSKWHAGWYVREINDGDQWLQRFRHRECTRGIASCRRPLPSRLESSSRIDFFS